ncbi:MAG: pantoate kinase [Hadesarchaea archaeon]|nr:pantoate kinase [Hadesarchaea archaeon]
MRKIVAFVPAHISGFFQPCEASDPKRTGSRNCGPCLTLGVRTEVQVERDERTRVRITVDGKRAPEATTTLAAVNQLLSAAGASLKVEVNHFCQVPVGAGYGASGAGTLGAALALSGALGLRLPREKLVTVAHVAEVANHTGLGDVGAQASGGLVIGVRPGAPPHGRWKRIPVPKDLKVVCATLGPLSTKKLLQDEEFRRRSSELGGRAVEKLAKGPTPERFISVSREFAEGLGLLDRELGAIIKAAEAAGALGASQVMLGRAVFALVKERNLEAVKRALSDLLEPRAVFTASFSRKGATLLG